MFRRTVGRQMKPFLHAFSPGVRPSEKGMLYRNNYMNGHARVASLQRAQRTTKERMQYLLLVIPDQVMFAGALLALSTIVLLVSFGQQPYQVNLNKTRWMVNGMSQHEQYERNDKMGKIFEMHSERIRNTREALERPDVLRAPAGYESPSGVYS